MSNKQQRMLADLFHEPVSGNIHWRDIEHLLAALGVRMEEHGGAGVHVYLNGRDTVIHRPHHSTVMDKREIRALRQFLSIAGVNPAA